jgi:1-acyl-sn-glycerol-3-phosphate acyltransferase
MKKRLALFLLKLMGWTLESKLPDTPRFVAIGAPHTSNWDFPIGLLGMWALDADFRWVGKHTLFRGPAKWLFTWLGGIPVDRRVHSGFINRSAELLRQSERMALVLAPEGTRSRTDYWKSGFYHIAVEAGVPIALGYIDFGRKMLGIGGSFMPSGDINADMEIIREFYRGKTGKRPGNTGEIRVRPG